MIPNFVADIKIKRTPGGYQVNIKDTMKGKTRIQMFQENSIEACLRRVKEEI
jgi:hypothetical protein